MSKLFYDHIIELNEIEDSLNQSAISHEEKLEIWKIIDAITHYKILHRILSVLPKDHHHTFLSRFHESPFDEEILDYLNENSPKDMIEEIESELQTLTEELLETFTLD